MAETGGVAEEAQTYHWVRAPMATAYNTRSGSDPDVGIAPRRMMYRVHSYPRQTRMTH